MSPWPNKLAVSAASVSVKQACDLTLTRISPVLSRDKMNGNLAIEKPANF